MAKENFTHDELLDLMGAGEPASWYEPTRKPSVGDAGVDQILHDEERILGNRLMAQRTPTSGHREDRAHHPNRRVDRPSFGI